MTPERELQLDQLRLDRRPAARAAGRRGWAGYLAAGCVLAAGLGGVLAVRSMATAAHPVLMVQTPRPVGAGAASMAAGLDSEGYVVARRVATVSAKTTGRVKEVDIEEGQHVVRGQVIARLDDSNIAAAREQARADLLRAIRSREAARIAVQDALPQMVRQRYLAQLRDASQTSFETQKAAYDSAVTAYRVQQQAVVVAQAALAVADRAEDDMVIAAPFSGVVTVKAAQIGEIVSPISAGGGFTRTGLCTIVDMDSMEVETDVSESFIRRIVPGQAATVRLNAYPDRDLPGHVLLVIPMADRAKATVKVRVLLDRRPAWVFPEMAVRVSFLSAQEGDAMSAARSHALLVPAAAIHQDSAAGEHYAYVVRDNVVHKQTVTDEKDIGNDRIILSGLQPDDKVVTGGQHVDQGEQVDIALSP